ncbi:MAG: hypothetical protein IKZ74_08125 [Clostridiales bacterium]|nr:hypothetical protein [Clostridiales bacterium]
MSREKTRQTFDSRRFAAFLILVAFLASAVPSVLFARTVLAEDPLAENNKVYHDNEYFELYHTVNGEPVSKILEYLYAETITGATRPVYCVMAGAPTPENGSITPAVMNDPGAAELLGRIQYIIEIGTPSFAIPDTINGHPHVHYYVRQLLIWHLVYLYQDSLGASARPYFKGIDLNTFIDGEGSGPTAKTILAEAKRLWDAYESVGRPSMKGAYTPNYRAEFRSVSGVTFDWAKKKYKATFSITVRETKTGDTGGAFRFSNISGGKLYIKGVDGNYTTQATTNGVYASGSAFQIEGSFNELVKATGGRTFGVQVLTVSNSGNELPQQMYGYFFDSSLTASGKTKQTYVGWHLSSAKTYEGSETLWTVPTAKTELRKVSVFADITVPEAGAAFRIYSADYGSFESAKADGLAFECVSDAQGKIVEKTTGLPLELPSGTFSITQTVVPEGTKAMSPNPAYLVVDAKKGTNSATFTDEIASGCFTIEKRIETGYDEYKNTAFPDLAPEEGAVFQVWNTNYTSYDGAPPAYRDLLTTDAAGKAKSKNLPYGDYKVHQIESEATKTTYVCADEIVQIRGTGSSGLPEKALQLTNKRYELKLRLLKTNKETGEIVPAKGVEFQVLDENNNVLSDWDGNDTFVTKEDGTADLEKLGLPVGTYYLSEKKAPAGFVLSDELVKIEVKKDETFVGVGPNGDLKAVPFADEEAEVSLVLLKTGEQLTSAAPKKTGYEDLTGYDFIYSEEPLLGAVFEVYCNEDILDFERDISLMDPAKYPEGSVVISSDGKTFAPYKCYDKDGDGVKETPLKKDTYLGKFTTDADGKIEITGLSLNAKTASSSFRFVETSAPDGYILDSTPVVFEVTDTRTDTSEKVIRCKKSVSNERVKNKLQFEKLGREYTFDEATSTYIPSEKSLPGAVFGIYAEESILSSSGDVLIEKDELIEVIVSDEKGMITSDLDYPAEGKYYTREIAAPLGYVLCEDSYSFPIRKKIVNEVSCANLRIVKLASDTELPMKDVEFEILTFDGRLIEKLVTDENGVAVSKNALPYGETIVLREISTDARYSLAEDKEIVITKCSEKKGEPCEQEIVLFNDLSVLSVEKRSSADGGLLGHCGVSVREKDGNVLWFRWDMVLLGYVLCEETDPGATQILYTNDVEGSEMYGRFEIRGLPKGDYEIFEVEAPEGYRNDSEVMPVSVEDGEVLGVTRLYDSMKTSERDLILGIGACGICGVSAIALFSLAFVELKENRRRRKRR